MTRVLVVEDDAQTAAEIAAALGDHGFEVECAATGQDALDRAVADRYSAISERHLVDEPSVASTLAKFARFALDPSVSFDRKELLFALIGSVALVQAEEANAGFPFTIAAQFAASPNRLSVASFTAVILTVSQFRRVNLLTF